MNKFVRENEKFAKKKHLKKIKDAYSLHDWTTVIKQSTKYLEEYGNDVIVLFMRAKSYKNLNKFKEALNDLKYCYYLDKTDKYILVELYFLYYYLNMYKEALELLYYLYKGNMHNKITLRFTEYIMKKQLNLPLNNVESLKDGLLKKQLIDFDEELAINHIKKHAYCKNIESDEVLLEDETKSKFNEKINIDSLYEIIKSSIDHSKKSPRNNALEIHYYAISNIGYIEQNICNFLKVIVIPNTNNIISMYPTDDADIKHTNILNIDYKQIYNQPKTKKLSMIAYLNNRA